MGKGSCGKLVMKTKRLRVQVGLGVVLLLGALSFMSACGGGPSAPVSPPPQSKPSTPQTQPVAPPQIQPATPPTAQPVAPPQTQPVTPPGASNVIEIPVSIRDNTFDDVRVKAGTKVVFVITNTTQDMHTFEAPDFALYKEIKAGATARYEWTVSNRKGSWDLGCFLTSPGGVHDGMDKAHLIIE